LIDALLDGCAGVRTSYVGRVWYRRDGQTDFAAWRRIVLDVFVVSADCLLRTVAPVGEIPDGATWCAAGRFAVSGERTRAGLALFRLVARIADIDEPTITRSGAIEQLEGALAL